MSRAPSGTPRRGRLASVLRDFLSRASHTLYGDRAALYMVQLTDPDGLALALRIHAQIRGPDPVVLRERALAREISEPFMPGTAPVETLARILETSGPDAGSSRLRAWAVREAFADGAVPLVILHHGQVLVTTLGELEEPAVERDVEELGGWFRSCMVDA